MLYIRWVVIISTQVVIAPCPKSASYNRNKNKMRKLPFRNFLILSGEEGIRTPETLLTFTRFPGGPVQPLLHLSVFRSTKIEKILNSNNFFTKIVRAIRM